MKVLSALATHRLRPLPIRSGALVRWLFRGPLLEPIVSFLAATIVTVGPWVVSVVALAAISMTMTPVLGREAIEDLRLAVVYAFGLSLFVTAPIATVSARLIRSAVDEDQGRLVVELYVVCLVLAAAATQVVAVVIASLLGGMRLELAVAFVTLSVSASLLWTGFAVMSALREMWRLIRDFTLGMLIATGCGMFSARGTPSVEIILWCFSIGMLVAHFLMSAYLIRATELHLPELSKAARRIAREVRGQILLFAGVMLAVVGLWIDKLVFWLGPDGMSSLSSFLHYSTYDSAMFFAHLSIVPTFAAIFLLNERVAEPRISAFWQLLRARPTYSAMAAAADTLSNDISVSIFRIAFIQVTFTALFVLLSAHLIVSFSMEMRQLELMRIGLIAALLQALFFANCFVVMLCNRTRAFFELQLIFCATNLVAGILAYAWFGISAYGVFVASLASFSVSAFIGYRTLKGFLFSVFVQDNTALYSSSPNRPREAAEGPDARPTWRRRA